jgi:major membrane immunogen (membrane-anchored lipoprotein)
MRKYLMPIGLCITIILASCSADNKNSKLIIGSWHAAQWQSNGKSLQRNVETTYFTFTDKGTYTFENNGTLEYGTYKVENDNLFTTAKDKQEIMVKLVKLTTDSLVFDMNNGGQAETLTLVKK